MILIEISAINVGGETKSVSNNSADINSSVFNLSEYDANVMSSRKSDATRPDLSIYYNLDYGGNVSHNSIASNFDAGNDGVANSAELSINGTSFPPYEGGPSEYDDIISFVSKKHDISEHLIKRIIKTESNFKVDNVSHKGATGLMQLMPITAKTVGVTDRLDPLQNIEGGVKYLKKMLKDHDGDLTMALAAYNAGPGNVKKYGGIPPFKETQNYIKKILG